MSGSQLIPDASRMPAFRVDPFKLVIVGLDTNDGPEHELYDVRVKDPIDDSFVESIIALGVIQSVRVAVREGTPYVVAGRQRVRGAREAIARLKARNEVAEITVPCIGERMTNDGSRLAQMAIVENEHRRDDGPLAKAAKAQTLLDRGLDIARIALVFGVSVSAVQSWLKIGSLAAPVKKAIEAGAITSTAAAKWADLPKADQVAALELAVASSPGKRVSTKAAERTVRPDGPSKPSRRVALAAIEAMPGSFADGIRFALGMLPEDEWPDAVSSVAKGAERMAAE